MPRFSVSHELEIDFEIFHIFPLLTERQDIFVKVGETIKNYFIISCSSKFSPLAKLDYLCYNKIVMD